MDIETIQERQAHRVVALVELSNGHRVELAGEWTKPSYDETSPAVEREKNVNTWQTPVYKRVGMIPALEDGQIAELSSQAHAVGECIAGIAYHVEVRTEVTFKQTSVRRSFHKHTTWEA